MYKKEKYNIFFSVHYLMLTYTITLQLQLGL